MNRLFVYGTLRSLSKHPMHRYLAQNAAFLGEGTIRSELYDLGRYPGVWIPEDGTDRVVGEVYDLNPDTAAEVWPTLDDYEMCGENDPEPHLYGIQHVHAILDNGTKITAMVYALNSLPIHARRIPSGDYFGQ